jgi:hypothetical protein
MRNRGCFGRVGCLIVLLLIVLIVIYFLMQGGFGFFFGGGTGGNSETAPGAPAGVTAPNTSGQLIFRLTWQGDQIVYNGNEIDEQRFAEIVQEAKELGGRIECQKSSDVTVDTAERRRRLMDEVGVPYHGC